MKKLPPTTPASPAAPADPIETLAQIGPVARSSVVDAVSDRLRGEILAGRLAAGSRLPSERELSLALGVNRLTLRAALARLEAMGLVSTRHGSGTEVASWRERAGLDALPMVMGSLVQGEPAWVELLTSMLEIRRILSAEAIALAAVRHTEEDLAAMKAIAAEQKLRLDDAAGFAIGDLAFQRALVRAARNVGMELILNSFARFPDEQPALIETLYDRRENSLGFYGAVIDLVRSGDGRAARTAVQMAFTAMDDDWLKRHGLKASVEAFQSARRRDPAPIKERMTRSSKTPPNKRK
jgi:GntR family transcriptional regulator, transcriptional repressor for pyruvate dehydrogenase complex